MKLYLVQHGDSKPEEVDPSRGLTDKGRRDVGKVAAFIKPLSLSVKTVWQSGKTRATQTAEILAPALAGSPQVTKHAGIAPMDPVRPIAAEIVEIAEDLMVVGHLPFMAKLASLLAAGSEDAGVVAFQQGGVVCLERDDKGVWRIRWMVVPELLA
jgi:phosphohistidine phosphatase